MTKFLTLICTAATLFGVAALANSHSGGLNFTEQAAASAPAAVVQHG